MRRLAIILPALLVLSLSGDAGSTENYAKETGKGCSFCHEMRNGGPLNEVGFAYVRNGYEYPVPERVLDRARTLRSPFHSTMRAVLGYIHLVFACIFVGAIFYVHIFIRPSQLKGGIPRGERKLGLSCMSVLTATGIYLTWYRLDSPSAFFESHFGLLLFIKLILFAIMVSLGLLAVTLVNRMMRKESLKASTGAVSVPGNITRENISSFDGRGGRPAYFLYEGKVYDVTGSEKWLGGTHFRKHSAGRDLTADLESAPHGTEVFDRLPVLADLGGEAEGPAEIEGGGRIAGGETGRARKIFVVMAHANLVIVFLILLCVSSWLWGIPIHIDEASGSMAREQACADCHRAGKPGIYHDWERSLHARVGVSCADCHEVHDDSLGMASSDHLEHSPVPVTALVTPGRCATCHQEQAAQYGRSKHAHTLEIIDQIDKWVIYGMNNDIELTTGCLACHGSVVTFSEDGRPEHGTWPNVGVGRVNPDGTLGSCTSCHTRHAFSLVEARKPEACDQCHLGPDHPQIEIYNESKHGTIYHAEGDTWNWRPDDMRWSAGRDYRAPTCAACHMSQAGDLPATHDVTERLSWELQAPLTIRPEKFVPFPAPVEWATARAAMSAVCLQCHSSVWTEDHFENLDGVIENYNDEYYKPAEKMFSRLVNEGLISDETYFDEPLEWEFYELWHHEGRRARMGAAMMAPDYAWWHGFYELKHRYATFMEESERLLRAGRSVRFDSIPGTQ